METRTDTGSDKELSKEFVKELKNTLITTKVETNLAYRQYKSNKNYCSKHSDFTHSDYNLKIKIDEFPNFNVKNFIEYMQSRLSDLNMVIKIINLREFSPKSDTMFRLRLSIDKKISLPILSDIIKGYPQSVELIDDQGNFLFGFNDGYETKK